VLYHNIPSERESETRRNSLYDGEETASHASVWQSNFSEGRKKASNALHAHVSATVIWDTNIFCFRELMLGKKANYSVWSCIHQWHNCWKCWNNYPWTPAVRNFVYPVGPKDVNICPKAQNVAMPAGRLHWFELEENIFLELILIFDEMWVHYFTPESKWSSMEWHHKGSPLHKKLKTAISWQGHGKCVLKFRRSPLCWFSSTWSNSNN
jgi:hypothetical protein